MPLQVVIGLSDGKNLEITSGEVQEGERRSSSPSGAAVEALRRPSPDSRPGRPRHRLPDGAHRSAGRTVAQAGRAGGRTMPYL